MLAKIKHQELLGGKKRLSRQLTNLFCPSCLAEFYRNNKSIINALLFACYCILEYICSSASAAGYYPPAKVTLGPWMGSGCPAFHSCECSSSQNNGEEFLCQIEHLAAYDIPITVYLFDGYSWSSGDCDWNLGDQVKNALAQNNIRALVHCWGGCFDSANDNNVFHEIGDLLLGIYFDDGIPDYVGKRSIDWIQSVMPGNSDCILKAYASSPYSFTDNGLQSFGNFCYVDDLSPDISTMHEGIARVFAKSNLLPGPYQEFLGYGCCRPDEQTYYRRLHFGSLQVVMANTPAYNSDPWNPLYGYSPDLLAAYRYWSWLHLELVPYLYSYVYNMYENPSQPVFRECDSAALSTKLGEEIFVQYVATKDTRIPVKLPAGEWINYWDETQVFSGPRQIENFPVPFGKEPLFIKQGAIIPMQVTRPYTGHGTSLSTQSLTVLIYPPEDSSLFNYWEDTTKCWIAMQSHSISRNQLTISTSKRTAKPIIYRISRWDAAPKSVGVDSTIVSVGQNGNNAHELASDSAVDGSSDNAWYYDAAMKRLIIKSFQTIAPPLKTVLATPANTATNQPISLTFKWNKCSIAALYHFQLSLSSDFSNANLKTDTGSITIDSLVVGSLTNGTTYYWRVSAANAGGSGEWSDTFSLTTIVASPAAPVLLAPADSAVNIPVNSMLQWRKNAAATLYRIQISTDSTFCESAGIDSTGFSQPDDTIFSPGGLANNTNYYWRVCAINAGGNSCSNIWHFTTIVPVPIPPMLLSPKDTVRIDSIPFFWHAGFPIATRYWLELSHDSSMANPIIDSTISDTTTIVRGMTNNKIYWWRARAGNIAGWGAFSEAAKFFLRIPSTGILPRMFRFSATGFSNSRGMVRYSLAHETVVSISICNMQGCTIASLVTAIQPAGCYSVSFCNTKLAAGPYVLIFRAGKFENKQTFAVIQ